MEGGVQMLTDVRGVFANVLPEMTRWDVEPVLIRIGSKVRITILRHPLFVFLLPHVTEAFEEKQAENVMFVVCGIDGPAQDVGGLPEMAFKLAECQKLHGSGLPGAMIRVGDSNSKAYGQRTPIIGRTRDEGV